MDSLRLEEPEGLPEFLVCRAMPPAGFLVGDVITAEVLDEASDDGWA